MDNFTDQAIEFLKSLSTETINRDFLAGVLLVTAIAVLYIIIRILLKVLFRGKKRCHGINISSDGGQLYITTNAIADLIKSMKSTFVHIDINRVDLTRRNGNYVISLLISFDMNGGELTNQVSQLREKIIADLKSVFGIENVSQINVKLKKTSRPNTKPSTQPILTPAPAPMPEITQVEETVSDDTVKMDSKNEEENDKASEDDSK